MNWYRIIAWIAITLIFAAMYPVMGMIIIDHNAPGLAKGLSVLFVGMTILGLIYDALTWLFTKALEYDKENNNE